MALKSFQQPQQKACVVGLDGVPFSMIRRFAADGTMPRMKALIAAGSVAPMTVSLPEISSVSWSTFMTARNPGEHGIFGFTDLHEGTYKASFPGFRELKCETIFDRIGKQKMRSVVINQPATYPARPMHGILVSGFVAVHLDKSVFPARHLQTLRDMKYEIDLDAAAVRDDPVELFRQLHAFIDMRKRLVEILWDDEQWNLMEVVITGTDRLHHFLMDAYEDTSHPYHAEFRRYYTAVDAFVGWMYDRFEKTGYGEHFYALSDHGFCRTEREVYPNVVLAKHGYLKLVTPEATALEDISESSRAFCLDPARIYIHRRGRHPRGSVGDGEVAAVKRELTELFQGLTDNGKPVVRHVFDGADVYSGPEAYKGPDLMLVPYNGFDLKGRVRAPDVSGERRLQGMHTWDDAFVVSSRAGVFDDRPDLSLIDVPIEVLGSLDVDPSA